MDTEFANTLSNSLKRELSLTDNDGKVSVNPSVMGTVIMITFPSYHTRNNIRFYFVLNINIDKGKVVSISVKYKVKGETWNKEVLTLTTKHGLNSVGAEYLTSIILAVKNAVEMGVIGEVSNIEQFYVYEHLLNLEPYFDMEFNLDENDFKIIKDFKGNFDFIHHRAVNVNITELKSNYTGDYQWHQRNSSKHNKPALEETIKSNPPETHEEVLIRKETLKELLEVDEALQGMTQELYMEAVLRDYINRRKSPEDKLRDISSDFRMSDK